MRNLIVRTLTGIVFVVVIFCSALWNQMYFTILFLGFLILGLLEYYRLLKGFNIKPQIVLGLLSGICIFLSFSLFSMNLISYKWLPGNLVVLLSIFIAELYSKNEHPFQNIAFTILGILYIAIPYSLMSFLFDPLFKK